VLVDQDYALQLLMQQSSNQKEEMKSELLIDKNTRETKSCRKVKILGNFVKERSYVCPQCSWQNLIQKTYTCNNSVLLPTPGSPPTKTKEPSK
jgi:hypothetical protein